MPIAPMLLEQHEVIITENSVDRRETKFLSSSQERMGMAVHRDTTSRLGHHISDRCHMSRAGAEKQRQSKRPPTEAFHQYLSRLA